MKCWKLYIRVSEWKPVRGSIRYAMASILDAPLGHYSIFKDPEHDRQALCKSNSHSSLIPDIDAGLSKSSHLGS